MRTARVPVKTPGLASRGAAGDDGRMRDALKLFLLAVAALALTLLSLEVERVGPELGEAGNLCGPNRDQWCYVPVLNGGWPFAYLFDKPSISVPNQLGVEDKFETPRFLLDLIFYFGALTGAWLGWRRRRGR